MANVSPVGVPTCYRHSGRETYVRCTRCDRPICPDCMNEASVGFQCPECVAQGRRTQRPVRTAFGGTAIGQHGYVTLTLIVVNVLMLLASLASTVRRLLLEKERARAVVGERVLRSSRDWEAEVFPTIPPAEVGKKKPYGFWMKYQAAMRFTREELLTALAGLAEADVAMKSGQDGRLALERALLGLLGRDTTPRRTT